MFKRLIPLFLSLTLALGAFTTASVTTPSPVSATAGYCNLATGTSDKLVAWRYASYMGGTYLDVVRGDATVADLDPCVYQTAGKHGGGAYVLLANVQKNPCQSGCSPRILQIGYGITDTGSPLDFYYVPDIYSGGAAVAWPGSLTPVLGHRVRGLIEKVWNSNYGRWVGRYTIVDLTTGVTQYAYSNYWEDTLNLAWWGAEVADTGAELGAKAGSAHPYINMAYLGYSPNTSSSVYFRTGMTVANDVYADGNIKSCEIASIGNWYYTGDMLQVSNDC